MIWKLIANDQRGARKRSKKTRRTAGRPYFRPEVEGLEERVVPCVNVGELCIDLDPDMSGGGEVFHIVEANPGGPYVTETELTVSGSGQGSLILDCPPPEVGKPGDLIIGGPECTVVGRHPIVSYEWDFGFNGTFRADRTGQTASYSFENPDFGEYTLALLVTDASGAIGLATTTVTLRDDDTTPPSVTIDVDAEQSDGDDNHLSWSFSDVSGISHGRITLLERRFPSGPWTPIRDCKILTCSL